MLKLLDVVEVSLGDSAAVAHQPEDRKLPATWLLSLAPHALEIDEWLELAVDHHADFLVRGSQDRVSENEVAKRPLRSSLALVRPSVVVWTARNAFGQRQVRASFTLPNVNDGRGQPIGFDLAVTDSQWKSQVLKVANGASGPVASARLGLPDDIEMYLTLSVGEPYNGSHFKLVAAVIPRLREMRSEVKERDAPSDRSREQEQLRRHAEIDRSRKAVGDERLRVEAETDRLRRAAEAERKAEAGRRDQIRRELNDRRIESGEAVAAEIGMIVRIPGGYSGPIISIGLDDFEVEVHSSGSILGVSWHESARNLETGQVIARPLDQ